MVYTEFKCPCFSVPRALWRYPTNTCGASFIRSPQEKHLALATHFVRNACSVFSWVRSVASIGCSGKSFKADCAKLTDGTNKSYCAYPTHPARASVAPYNVCDYLKLQKAIWGFFAGKSQIIAVRRPELARVCKAWQNF